MKTIALIEADIEALLIKHSVTGERQFWFQRNEVKSAMREVMAHIAAQYAEIAQLREKHEQEVENILDDAQEWAVYVIEDSAPCSLRHRLNDEINQRAALAATKKDPL